MTFNDLLAGAMRDIGKLPVGGTPSSDETQDGFLSANLLLESWSLEFINIFTVGSATYPLVTTKQSYQIGVGAADFNTARPVKIEQANITLPNPGGAGVLRWPLKILTFAEWQSIEEPGAAGTTSRSMYYDHAFPIGTLNFHPVPTFGSNPRSVELWVWTVLTAFPDFVTDVPLPPGYGRAFQQALAIEIAPQYRAPISDVLSMNAAQAKAAIRALNASVPGQEPTAQPLDNTPAQAPPPQQQAG